jgi:tryptophanase
MAALCKAGFNTFALPADMVTIDLISDSGTSAMSAAQWRALFSAREDFSGQAAYTDFVREARALFGMRFIQPVHQGRVAENLLCALLVAPGDVVVSNTHFETTRANIEARGACAIDLPYRSRPYCGNINITKLISLLHSTRAVRCIILTITSNILGGQPLAMENMRRVRTLGRRFGIPVLYDASRFADNAYFIQRRMRQKQTVRGICRQMFTYADTVYLSCKKSVLSNIGGCIATRSRPLFNAMQVSVLQQESYPSSGGLAARDLAAMTRGLQEAVDESYLCAHAASVGYLARQLQSENVRIKTPVGCHAIAIQPRYKTPYAAHGLAAQVFLDSGIRGGVFDGLYRLALPRRVYTNAHLDYAAIAVGRAYRKKTLILRPRNRPSQFDNFLLRFTRS